MKYKIVIVFFWVFFRCFHYYGQLPHMSACIINSCNGSCDEGNNEIIFITTGNSSVLVNSTNLQVFYGSSVNPPVDYTGSLVNNTATTNALNTLAGCGGPLFVDATGTTVPPNSMILLTQNGTCAGAVSMSGLCSLGTIYIVYSSDPSWTNGGNFVNGVGNLRHFRTRITNTTSIINTIDYTYNLPTGMNTDGASATWSSLGGAASGYNDNNCVLVPTVLPTTILAFNSELINNQVFLTLEIEPQINKVYYEIVRTVDGENFELLENIEIKPQEIVFTTSDILKLEKSIIYQLFEKRENDRKILVAETVVQNDFNFSSVFPNPSDGEVIIATKYTCESIIVLDVLGNEVKGLEWNESGNNLFQTKLQNGVYIINVKTYIGSEVHKVVVH
jgi:hypothetical protein